MKYEILRNDHRTFQHPHNNSIVKVHRIIYIKDFVWTSPITDRQVFIKSGDLGGFIQSQNNLSHDDTSVVQNNAFVFGSAVLKNTLIRDTAMMFDNAEIDQCEIFGNATIFGKLKAKDCIFRDKCNVGGLIDMQRCYVTNAAQISGIGKIFDTAMYGGSMITGQMNVYDCELTDVSEISGVSTVRNCRLSGRAVLKNAKFENQSFSETISLGITQQDGDLFPH